MTIGAKVSLRVSKGNWAMRFGAIALALATGCGSGSDHESVPAASFQELRASESSFYPVDISADGGTVVGRLFDLEVSLLWQEETGFVDAGTLLGDASAELRGVSRDGRVVVGTSGERAFRWTRTGGLVWLPTIDDRSSSAQDVSANGHVTIGSTGSEPVIWIEDGTPRRLVWDDDPEPYWAQSVSADGRAVAGTFLGGSRQVFRWQASTSIIDLAAVPGGSIGFHRQAISGDGQTVCGRVLLRERLRIASSQPCVVHSEPFCWTEATGSVVLPRGSFERYVPPDGCPGAAIVGQLVGVNHDGSIVVGSLGERERGEIAVRWDSGDPQAIGDLLKAHGIDLGGWRLTDATGVSADGKTIVGTGVSPSGDDGAWIAVVPRSP
jgi:uncharacterized membrane protein